jgi:hypothetical protein
MNPLLGNATLSNANMNFSGGTSGIYARGTIGIKTGKWYSEIVFTTISGASSTVDCGFISPDGQNVFYYKSDGNKGLTSGESAYGATYTTNDVIGVAVDFDARNVTFYKNNTSQGTFSFSSETWTDDWVIYARTRGTTTYAGYLNCGQRPFSYTPPTGFVRLNTFNLPDSTIKKGNTVMDATLWTGNGTSQTIVNAGQFKPDFVWIKRRDGSGQDHVLQDSNRGFGATTKLASSSTAAENTTGGATGSEWGYVTAANSNGFNITASTNGDQVNKNTWTYAGWQWQAGQGTNTSNTSGSITSTVSVNATAGFSVVTYASSSGTNTVGHGLGVAPKMVIWKSRTNTTDWVSYHASLGASKYINLNSTAAAVTNNLVWNNTAPTSTVVTIGSDLSTYGNIVMYCWAEIAGFSKFGSYTGNGSADGPFVFTGFRPKFIIMKNSSAVFSWYNFDTARLGYNDRNDQLYPNLSNAEDSSSGNQTIDILSNGFKIRNSTGNNNGNGNTIIYAAFAENPFKNANAR